MTVSYEPQLARQFQLEINTGTDVAPVWTHISGITNISPSHDSTKTDDSDFDSNGRARHSVVERGDTLQVDMLYLEADDGSGDRDPGQQAVMDSVKLIGNAAKKTYRYVFPSGTTGVTFKASADMAYPGGGKTDNASQSVTLTVDGDVTDVTIP